MSEAQVDVAGEHVDVLIVGAGISGIGCARHLQDELPGKTYAILEARDAIGGTWDLFRYPGIRSDSDLRPSATRSSPGPARRRSPTAPIDPARTSARPRAKTGIDRHIRYGHRVIGASWSSARGALDGHRAAQPTPARRSRSPAGWLFCAQRLLPLRRGLHARTSRGSSVSAARSCTRSTGPRTSTRRQAHPRDRQRRDRRHARARAGRARART